jgi:hypothetical protein
MKMTGNRRRGTGVNFAPPAAAHSPACELFSPLDFFPQPGAAIGSANHADPPSVYFQSRRHGRLHADAMKMLVAPADCVPPLKNPQFGPVFQGGGTQAFKKAKPGVSGIEATCNLPVCQIGQKRWICGLMKEPQEAVFEPEQTYRNRSEIESQTI